MKVRRVGVAGVAVRPPHGLAQEIVSHRDGVGGCTEFAKTALQTSADKPPTLPDELVEEILVRVEPAHLVSATIVCKAWHNILSDDAFRRRYRRFHKTLILQGYFYDDYEESAIRFVPMTSMSVSAFCAPKVYNRCSWTASELMDCRHGRVLISQAGSSMATRLIVWDPISGSQQHVSLPAYPQYPYPYKNYYVASVLCAKNHCDHLDCHGGPFLVVFVVSSHDYDRYGEYAETWASVYSSETGAWSASMTPNVKTRKHIDMTPSLLIGDALYFNTVRGGYSIVKYDLCKHELSVINLPADFEPILIKGIDGELAFATTIHNCIYMWSSWQVDSSGDGGSFKYRVLNLDETLLPKAGHKSTELICMAEGTNTVFIRLEGEGLFTLDLKSKQVRKICEKETSYIFPYTSFQD